MGRRRDAPPRPRDELTFLELLDLSAIPEVYEDKRYCELYLTHRDEVMAFGARPGRRPMGWWILETDDDAPQPADFEEADEFTRAGIRWLASNGLLEDDETRSLLNKPREAGLTPYAREQAERDADALLEGLGAKHDQENTKGDV